MKKDTIFDLLGIVLIIGSFSIMYINQETLIGFVVLLLGQSFLFRKDDKKINEENIS
jgi:Fe-S cluster assembly iron-binding protein IscA